MTKKGVIQGVAIYICVLILIISGIFSIHHIIDEKNKTEISINIVEGVSDSTDIIWETNYAEPWGAVADNGEYIIGTEYDCILYNKSDKVFHDWTIELEMPELGKMENWWNCECTESDGKIILKPVDYNLLIQKRAEIPIGFIMNSREVMERPNMVIKGYFEQSVRQVGMYWIMLLLLFIWAVTVFVNILVMLFTKRYQRLLKEKIEKEIAREATYIAKGTQQILESSVLVDFKSNTYSYLEKWSNYDSIPLKGGYDTYIEYQVSSQVMDEEKEHLASVLKKENIINALGSEKEEITYVSHSDDGIERWKMTHVVVMERVENVVTKVLFLKMDITHVMEEQRKNEIILKDALHMVQCANKAKTSFLSNMSHDIRTPMNAIIGFTNLASANIENKEKVEEYLKKIENSGKHLLSLINDILDMSRIESGKIEIEENIYNLEEMAQEVYDLMHSQAEDKHIDFIVAVDVQNKYVFCDKLRINQVLLNLLSNAIKYTGNGGIVQFSIIQNGITHKDYERYQFRVKDNGYGMNKEFVKRIFEPFERENKVITNQIQGTGLGLAITKNIVDMMGGVIEVDTTEGKGSEFVVYVDFRVADSGNTEKQNDSQTVAKSVSDFELAGKRALIADDNEINLEIAVEILKTVGMELEVANNGKEALDMFTASKEGYYDLILMDVQMPVMDGLEAAKAIRQLDRKDVDIPIIALSANAFEEDVRKSLSSGMDGHISKPIIIETLFETLHDIIQRKS